MQTPFALLIEEISNGLEVPTTLPPPPYPPYLQWSSIISVLFLFPTPLPEFPPLFPLLPPDDWEPAAAATAAAIVQEDQGFFINLFESIEWIRLFKNWFLLPLYEPKLLLTFLFCEQGLYCVTLPGFKELLSSKLGELAPLFDYLFPVDRIYPVVPAYFFF